MQKAPKTRDLNNEYQDTANRKYACDFDHLWLPQGMFESFVLAEQREGIRLVHTLEDLADLRPINRWLSAKP